MTGFVDAGALSYIECAAGEVLDYSIDFTSLLSPGETVQTSAWLIPTGLSAGAASISSPFTTQWISGGTAGQRYTVTNSMQTNQGRTFKRSFVLGVQAAL